MTFDHVNIDKKWYSIINSIINITYSTTEEYNIIYSTYNIFYIQKNIIYSIIYS